MYDKVSLGNKIYIARKNKGLKQSDICQAINIGQSAFSDLETGKREITLTELYKLADALDAPISWLLGINLDNALTATEMLKLEEFRQYLINIRKK
ncbi:MAG: Helix-turn-helix domain [Herbinix sp.]|jgi:transcriptional regulator with XRE-family HTH domain|nr:Helix-turn-helix domain [Herbinix sp.]